MLTLYRGYQLEHRFVVEEWDIGGGNLIDVRWFA